MYRFISVNKNAYNVRRVEELSDLLLEKERALKEVTGFFKRLKLKGEIRKLNKQISIHGVQVLEYEAFNTSKALS